MKQSAEFIIAMTDRCKKLAVGVDKLDRLTSLPINVKHQIQEYMSIEDATKMSVLSSRWRYVWSSNPKLMFGRHFFTKRTLAVAIDIISTTMLQHHGAIKRLLLDISSIPSSQHSVVDKRMLFLSRNGLMDLALYNQNGVNAYKLPSYMYSLGLEHLVLSNCIYRPPCSFRGFDKLTRLYLLRVSFELEVATSSLRMPNLERLDVVDSSGLRFVNIYAPKVLHLNLYGCGTNTLKLSPFMDCGKLRFFALASQEEVPLHIHDKTLKLTNLLSSWPNLSHLILGKNFAKDFPSRTGAESLPMYLTGLRCLYFANYDFDREDRIFSLLYILRSSPNLKRLVFYSSQVKTGDMELDVNHFKGVDFTTPGLCNLETLQINMFHCSRIELHFVRFILASAPLLLKANLFVHKSVHESQSLKISKELMQFPRASPKLDILYKSWSKEKGMQRIPL